MSKPLAGKTIVLTRAAADNEPLATRLSQMGAQIILVPCIETVRLPVNPPMQQQLANFEDVAWVCFTSRNGVRYFNETLLELGLTLPAQTPIGAVGVQTAAAVQRTFARTSLVPPVATGRALGLALVETGEPGLGRVLIPGALAPRPELADTLREHDFRVTSLAVYQTIQIAPREPLPPHVNYVLFASPSAAEAFLAHTALPPAAHVVTIGATTSAAVRARGVAVQREALDASLEGMLAALV